MTEDENENDQAIVYMVRVGDDWRLDLDAAEAHLGDWSVALGHWQHIGDQAIEELREARAEVARLRKLFDDAGQGEHNVLALIDHYQDQVRALTTALDRQHGTPCEEIRHRQEVERLTRENNLLAAECAALVEAGSWTPTQVAALPLEPRARRMLAAYELVEADEEWLRNPSGRSRAQATGALRSAYRRLCGEQDT